MALRMMGMTLIRGWDKTGKNGDVVDCNSQMCHLRPLPSLTQ